MSLPFRHEASGARVGFTRNGNVRHIIDDWAPELIRRRSDVGFCGAEVVAGEASEDSLLCKKCVVTVRKLERELYTRQFLPNEEAIKSCLGLILQDSTPKLAKVIPLIPRNR